MSKSAAIRAMRLREADLLEALRETAQRNRGLGSPCYAELRNLPPLKTDNEPRLKWWARLLPFRGRTQ